MKPHKIYGIDNIDPKAVHDFYEALKCDFAVKGALMPDAHVGKALPIGGVIATKDVIVSSWVGYDLGCGVASLKTSIKRSELVGFEKQIFNEIYKRIPVGYNHRQKPVKWDMDKFEYSNKLKEIFNQKNGFNQLGTLGGGNHMNELGTDDQDNIWITIHSGSRGVGHGVGSYYMGLAALGKSNKEWHHGLDVNSQTGKDYIKDLNFCLEFALENRKQMIYETLNIVCEIIKDTKARSFNLINRNHNHAEFKDGLWIHRKGATHAEKGMMGVIPANMRDGVFIVEGKGCEDSLMSSSHGAGRVMGRREAKRKLTLEHFQDIMGDEITAKIEQSTLDESPDAYKDIHQVLADQEDLVTVVDHIKPIINIKG